MCFAAGRNDFALRRSDLSRGPSCGEPWYRPWRGVVTAHTIVEVQHNAERLWFNSVNRDTIFWTRMQLWTPSQRFPSTPYSHNTPKAFHEEPGHIYTSPGRQNMCVSFWQAPMDFSKICCRVEICSVVLGPRQNRTGYHPAWFNYFATSWHTLFLGGLAKRCCGSWFIHSCFHFCMWGWSICQSFGTLPKRHDTWHTRVSQTISRSKFP